MTRAFTGNVFLTTSKATMDAFFSNRYASKFDTLSKSQRDLSILAGPGRNDSLESFSYSFGVSNNSDQKFFVLKFLETGKLFEKYYLETNLTNETRRNSLGGIFQKRIYLSFGVGDDLRNWAGPFTLALYNSTYNLTESGLREIILKFVPITGPILRNQFDEPSIKRINNKSSSLDPKQIISDEIKISYKEITNFKVIDDSLVKVLKSYITKATSQSEVLVLLPKVGIYLGKKYSTIDLFANRRYDLTTYFNRIGLECQIVQPRPAPLIEPPEVLYQQQPKSNNPNDIKLFIRSTKPQQELDKTTIPDYYEPLRRVDASLYTILRERQILYEPYFVIEDNIKILELWKNKGWIKDSSKGVFVYGDKKLISTLLYLENVDNKSSAGSISYEDPIQPNEEAKKYEDSGYRSEFAEQLLKSNSSIHTDITDKLNIDSRNRDSIIVDFRYGVKEQNILALTVNSNPAYISLFNQKYVKASILQSVNNDVNLIKAFVKIILEAISSITQSLFPSSPSFNFKQELKNLPGSTSQMQLDGAQTAKALAASTTTKQNNQSPYVEATNNTQVSISEKSLIKILNRSFLKVSIRTLPFFHISSLTSLGRKCKITSVLPQILGKQNSINNSFLDGNYRIISFNHVITPFEMYSEFTLLKDFNFASSEINPETAEITPPAEVVQTNSGGWDSASNVTYGASTPTYTGSQSTYNPATEDLNCGSSSSGGG